MSSQRPCRARPTGRGSRMSWFAYRTQIRGRRGPRTPVCTLGSLRRRSRMSSV